jgi:hypothetical protein
MWPWSRIARLDERGVTLGRERFEFTDLLDASLEHHTLVLVGRSFRWRGRVRDAFATLDVILDGMSRAHPETSPRPYLAYPTAEPEAQQRPRRGRRRARAHVGPQDLWIGRTLYH